MHPRFTDKSILVSGAGAGIGRAASLGFAAEGGLLVAADRDAAAAERTAEMIRDLGGSALAVTADVTNTADIERMVASTVEEYGRLDIAFNNAGIAGEFGLALDETSDDQWDAVVSVNLTAVFAAMRSEIPVMRAQGGGVIVNTASVASLIGTPRAAAYTATKHGVLGLTRAAALEVVGDGIRINAICPGATRTNMLETIFESPGMEDIMMSSQPIGRLASPEEIATLVLTLASDDAAFMVGAALVADGGLSVG